MGYSRKIQGDLQGNYIVTSSGSCNLCGNASKDLVFKKDGYELVRCKSCGLLYLDNPPNALQRERLYSFQSGYHAELAQRTSAIVRHTAEATDNLRVLTHHVRTGRLLDIGCSTGLFLNAAKTKGWDVRGIEYSQDSARIARDKYNLPVDQGELHADAYPTNTFDVVTMWDVIEHLPDPRQTVATVHNILAPNGLMFLKTPNADGLFPTVSLAASRYLNYWGHPEPPEHLYQFSATTLTRLVNSEGFDVLKIHHRRIPIEYSFGNLREWFRSAKWLAYCAAFAPFSMVGPYLGLGDDITVIARKRQ
jgi:2-polyprenyl-3-methyl-5-hydroxy-6-metoxy-1,4-benzoquinol methylase